MKEHYASEGSLHLLWANFRFSVIGKLLACPPQNRGDVNSRLLKLALETWIHPITGEPLTLGFSTIETWYYKAKNERKDPIGSLRRKVRKDCGRERAMPEQLSARLIVQHRQHPSWSYKLHADNLYIIATAQLKLKSCPSYSTIYRFMKRYGLTKLPRRGPPDSPGGLRIQKRFEHYEVRSYEQPFVNSLWHADFHSAKRKVLLADGTLVVPWLLAVIDDFSRLGCHCQWYIVENAENLVHGFCQALQKRGRPRACMTDNGGAELADEFVQGLRRLSIDHDTTLSYHPEANAKVEKFWQRVEGRLMAMLEGCRDLTLDQLNEATLAWLEMEYNREIHDETNEAPLHRFLNGQSIGLECPSSETLRESFTAHHKRRQRKTDGTIIVDKIRFEIPNRFRTLSPVFIHYAKWDLSRMYLVDPKTDIILCRLLPLDKEKYADGKRRSLTPLFPDSTEPAHPQQDEMAPLLKKLMADYAATGLPPAYLPQDLTSTRKENSDG